jgi:hypothetical protein
MWICCSLDGQVASERCVVDHLRHLDYWRSWLILVCICSTGQFQVTFRCQTLGIFCLQSASTQCGRVLDASPVKEATHGHTMHTTEMHAWRLDVY